MLDYWLIQRLFGRTVITGTTDYGATITRPVYWISHGQVGTQYHDLTDRTQPGVFTLGPHGKWSDPI